METKTEEQNNIKFIKEGSATIFEEGEKVFYNPVQCFNRDLSICVINVFLEILSEEKKDLKQKTKCDNLPPRRITLLEALSATGLRSIRYAKEIDGIDFIIANDFSKEAVEMITRNVISNNVEHIVKSNHADAM